MNDAPQLLVEWSSRWREFVSAIGPAVRRSPPRLTMEARAGLFPLRGLLLSLLLEFAVVAAAIVQPASPIRAVVRAPDRPHEVIYFSSEELPRTEDLAGAQSGGSGKSGGSSMHHPTQIIRVARDAVSREKVFDAPHLDLPRLDSSVSNLLAYREDVLPSPAEALPLAKRSFGEALAVAPPPAAVPKSQMHAVQFAPPAVVPPPVELPLQNLASNRSLPAAAVVPPPVSAPARATNQLARLTLPAEVVVAPRPEIGGAIRSQRQPNEFVSPVVPPPVEVAAVRGQAHASLSGTQAVAPPRPEFQNLPPRAVSGLGSAAVVPPLVDVNAVRQQRVLRASDTAVLPPRNPSPENTGKSSTGAGGNKASLAPAAGVIVSSRPGDRPGLPANAEKATLAMSPAGSAAVGTGGEGGGAGIGRGASSGSGPSGTGPGAISAAATSGKGAVAASDHSGISPCPGPGGAGNLSAGRPRVPGVSVSGGSSNVVSLPSFGAPPPPPGSGHSNVPRKTGNGITVVASSRSGGALNFYGALKGDRVYTIYIPSTIGTVVMQFADPLSAAHPYADDLTAPTAMRTELPSDMQRGHLVIRGTLDREGVVRNPSIVRSEASDFQSKILAALPDWKFTPAFRGGEAVEVNVILGFGVDTK